jgi:Zn ribbon nucleic-acid-binding protein
MPPQLTFTNWRRLALPWGEATVAARAYREATTEPGAEALTDAVLPRCAVRDIPDLTAIEHRQVVRCLGPPRTSLTRVDDLMNDLPNAFEGDEDILEHIEGAPVEQWDVLDAVGARVLDVWIWGVDCGVVFTVNTTDQIAYVAQFALWCDEDRPTWRALSIAHADVRSRYPGSELARMSFWAVSRCPQCDATNTVWKDDERDVISCQKCGRAFDALRTPYRPRKPVQSPQ